VPLVARDAVATLEVKNSVKTVADTIADFYRLYPQPPVLPMYRTFLMDLLKQVHLTVVDSRFKYDAVFALGAWETYNGLMSNYDKLGGTAQAEAIWPAFMQSCGLDPEKIKADAEAVVQWAKGASPAQVLETMEGSADGADQRVSDAFSGISTGLYSQPFSVGLFKMMEYSGVQATSDNVEQWAKALQIPAAKPVSDLETYRKNTDKLRQAEEMMREVEIREKKKLAERLEEKAKALAAKAAEKAEEAKEQTA
jgi:photosystem II biogenesis protein Psp29